MSYELLVGLNVIDDRRYQEYRTAMKPILSQFGGRFGYDFKVSEVLQSEVENKDINRVFTISFPKQTDMEAFFSDAEYLNVKTRYFESSVKSTTIISSYEK
ncbi:DUF1330 domain-containing protein [Photobacterium alginatilyticum]|uniref:DUF1330 domain-containing protein n=1 Tax=Photobacterium alginatilyticum TaxID=1775171 RepID=A0ABW9YDP6_9GAMM|nr:DUF1330 domain-containing protein [Photobacterium alginatilyticum]NBI51907.1 DUF1330 domain-containing protein [Photobacterium alginatilyticum]